MSFPKFTASKSICRVAEPATSATTATFETAKANKERTEKQKCSNVANVAAFKSRIFVFEDFLGAEPDPADRITGWLKQRPIPRKERELWKRLTKATEEFALGPWAVPAVQHGWNDCALFSQALGIVNEQLRRTMIITGFDASAATFLNRKGKIERYRRTNADLPPWWGDPRFSIGYVEREWIPPPRAFKPQPPTVYGEAKKLIAKAEENLGPNLAPDPKTGEKTAIYSKWA